MVFCIIGGESELSCVTTLPNILRQYNHELKGYATGSNIEYDGPMESVAQLNVAKNGAFSVDMLGQARELVRRARRLENIDFWNDWKIVTIYTGINDICSCQDKVNVFISNIKAALDYLKDNLPRTFVNLVQLYLFDDTKNNADKCSKFSCECAGYINFERKLRTISNFKISLENFIASGRYDDLDTFTVVLQTFFSTVIFNRIDDRSPLPAYCDLLSPAGHRNLALRLWNNMFVKVGHKSHELELDLPVTKISCPTDEWPYFYTAKNSHWLVKNSGMCGFTCIYLCRFHVHFN